LAGSSAPGVKEVLKLVQYWGGREEATVAVFGHRLPAYHAVLVNLMMCHALEIDDSHYPAIVHLYYANSRLRRYRRLKNTLAMLLPSVATE